MTRPVLPVEVLECGGPQIQINRPGAPPAELSLCRNRTSRTKPHVSARVKQNFEHLTALPGRGRLGDLHGLFFPRREGEDIKVARDLQRNFQHLDTDVQENGRLHRSISEGEEIRVGERTSNSVALLNARILIGETGQNLDGNRAAHHHMLGLENNAHAASTQAVENSIVAQDQPIRRTCLDSACLVLGQKAILNQMRQEFLRF